MKHLLIATACILIFCTGLRAQYNKCAPAVPVVALYYNYDGQAQYGGGLEAGMQGIDNPFGFYAGFYMNRYRRLPQQKDNSEPLTRGSLYIKGAFRITGYGSAVTALVTAAPEISVQTGFDIRPGIRLMMPVSGNKAIGLEPLYSIRQKRFSLNLIAAF